MLLLFFFLAGMFMSPIHLPCELLAFRHLRGRVHKFNLFEAVHYSSSKSKSGSNSTLVSQNLSITPMAMSAISVSSRSDSSHQRTNTADSSCSNFCHGPLSGWFVIKFRLSYLRLGIHRFRVLLNKKYDFYAALIFSFLGF